MSLHVGSTETANLNQPVLVVGSGEETRREAVMTMAQEVLCRTGQACKTCVACRQVAQHIHPDFIHIGPEDAVGIKAIRALLEKISRKAQTGRRVVIMEAVERLSIPAVNALLKTLEEPATDTQFILTTAYPGRLPATIRSRVQLARISNPLPGLLPRQSDGGDDEIDQIAHELGELLRKEGPSPSLRRAFMRLRDYYRIKSAKGNTKLARVVLRYSYEPRKRL